MRVVVVGVVGLVIGCGRGTTPHLAGDGGMDAPPDASLYAVSLGDPDVTASALQPRTVTVSGPAGSTVDIGLDRTTAGAIAPATLTLDAAGTATATYTPCTDVSPMCLGAATVNVTVAGQPAASTGITLVAPPEVGEVAPCQAGGNVMYLHGNDFIYAGQLTTDSMAEWNVTPQADELRFGVGAWLGTIQQYRGTFSLAGLAEPIAPGIYDHAQRAPAEPGHPGVEVAVGNHGCSQIDARFQVHDFSADPATGAVAGVTISFEQVCDGGPGVLVGCLHYAATPSTPVTPPAPDPAKVSVQVLSAAHDGTPDPNAVAIFTSSTGSVVLDTQVDMFGEAQAALPDGGELTVIQHASGYTYLFTYRGVKTGDHVVVNASTAATGTRDTMLATFTPPANATTVGVKTACGGGAWSAGTGPVSAELAFYDSCRTPTFDALTIATIPGEAPQFVWQPGVAHHPFGNLIVPNTWTPMSIATVTLAGIPQNSPSLNVQWSTLLDATPIVMGSTRYDSPAAGTQALSLANAPGAGEGAVVRVDSQSSLLSFESRTVAVAGAPTTVTVDFATPAVPLVSAVQQNALGVAWTETAAAADRRTVFWRASTATSRVMWTMIEPADGQAHTQLPTLPAAHAADDPTVDASTALHGATVSYDSYDVSGYRLVPPTGAYRAHSSTAESYDMQFPF